MSIMRRLIPAVAVSGSSLMVGCGGGSYGGSCGGSYGSYGSSYGSCGAPAVDPSGIYQGTVTNQATQQQTSAVAILAENGTALMSTQGGAYYHLHVGVQGSELSGSFQGYSVTSALPNAEATDSGSVSVTVTASGLTGTLKDNAGNQQSVALSLDGVYNQPSSLPMLAGTWTYTFSGFTLTTTIQPNGSLTAIDSNSCTYSGTFAVIDTHVDTYNVGYTRICNGVSASFSGLAAYFPAGGAAAPAYIQVFADDGAGDYLAADLQP